MRRSEQLAEFVRDALNAGHSRPVIRQALIESGWSATEADAALGSYAEGAFIPPVPKPMAYVSARQAFLYGLLFVTLGATILNISSLMFNLIDQWLPLPEEDEYSWMAQSRVTGIRWAIATLVVALPVFLAMYRVTERAEARDRGKRGSAIRKWFGYVTLFLALVGLGGDLVYVIYALLSGELTLRFALKAATVAVLALAVLLLFRKEIREDAGAA